MSVKYCFFCNRELPELASKFFHSEVPQGYAGGTQQLLTKSFHYYRCENCKVTFRYLKTTHLHTLFLTFEDKLTLPKNVTYKIIGGRRMILYCENCEKFRVVHAKWDKREIVVYCPKCREILRRYNKLYRD
ncbi:MAG: hypothetical protein ACTSRR_09825 [Candidatus Heimdallarchaeaceae archaeon]